MLVSNVIFILVCLFDYVLVQDIPSFGLRDLTFPGPPRMPEIPGFPESANEYIGGRFRPGSPSGHPPPQDWSVPGRSPAYYGGRGHPSPQDWNVPGRSPAYYGGRPDPLQQLKSERYTGTKEEAAQDINALGSRLTAAGKWDEFLKLAEEVKKKRGKRPPDNWEDDALFLAQYSRNLVSAIPKHEKATTPKPASQMKYYSPSPGMGAYWNDEYKPKPRTPRPSVGQPLKVMTGEEVMKVALKKMAEFQESENSASKLQPYTSTLLPENTTKASELLSVANTSQGLVNQRDNEKFKHLPKYDDFNTPIRWVPLYSKETSDGLARVTDPKTGRNQQFVIDGAVMVPVIDYRVERLGLTSTTTMKSVLVSDPGALRTVLQNMDLKTADRSDWLAYEVALGNSKYNNRCEGEGCAARCNRLGCESQCSGDTCSTGCVGGSCSSMCSGPGCLSMCIGENCSARCNGLSCEARCRGNNCEANCRSFSCARVANGSPALGGGTFEQHYPQYSVMPREDANYFTTY